MCYSVYYSVHLSTLPNTTLPPVVHMKENKGVCVCALTGKSVCVWENIFNKQLSRSYNQDLGVDQKEVCLNQSFPTLWTTDPWNCDPLSWVDFPFH